MDLSAHTRFPVALLRPLGHLSTEPSKGIRCRMCVPRRQQQTDASPGGEQRTARFGNIRPGVAQRGESEMTRRLALVVVAVLATLTTAAVAQGGHAKTLTVGQQSASCPNPGYQHIGDAIE